MKRLLLIFCLVSVTTAVSAQSTPDEWSPPRTSWGAPDIGGLWSSATVTPFQRPETMGDKAFLTEEEAATIEREVLERNARANAPSVVRTEPLPVGGNVGAYNSFWIDRGTTVVPTRRSTMETATDSPGSPHPQIRNGTSRCKTM